MKLMPCLPGVRAVTPGQAAVLERQGQENGKIPLRGDFATAAGSGLADPERRYRRCPEI